MCNYISVNLWYIHRIWWNDGISMRICNDGRIYFEQKFRFDDIFQAYFVTSDGFSSAKSFTDSCMIVTFA